jgi:hypothetical protein
MHHLPEHGTPLAGSQTSSSPRRGDATARRTVRTVTPEWKRASVDPDPVRDLGYELVDLEVVQTRDGSGRYMVLPGDEELLTDDAFIVASSSAICDVSDRV